MSKEEFNNVVSAIEVGLAMEYGDDILLCEFFVSSTKVEAMVPLEGYHMDDDFRGIYLGYEPINTAMEVVDINIMIVDTEITDAYDLNPEIRGFDTIIPKGIKAFLKCVNDDILKKKLKEFIDGE